MTDKPGKLRDCYHTAYAVSGLSLSQENGVHLNDVKLEKNEPVYNVTEKKYQECLVAFQSEKGKGKGEKEPKG